MFTRREHGPSGDLVAGTLRIGTVFTAPKEKDLRHSARIKPMSHHRSLSDFLASLQPRLDPAPAGRRAGSELLEETVEELKVAMEEMRVAEEELTAVAEAAERERLGALRFRDLVDAAPTAELLTTLDGSIVFANRRASALLGVDAGELVRKPLAVFVDDGGSRGFRRFLAQMAHAEGACTAELTLRPRRAMPVEIAVAAWPVPASDGTRLLGWRLDDAGARRAGEEALDDERALLRGVLDSLPVGAAAMDLDGSVLLWNRAARRLLGWSEEELAGRPNPALPDELLPMLDAVRAAGTEPALTLQVTAAAERTDGRPARVDLSLAPLADGEGRVVGTVSLIRPGEGAQAGGEGAEAAEAEARPRWAPAELRRVLFSGLDPADVTERLRGGIAAALDLGYLRPGDRLPGTREAASVSGIDHRVISAAYRRLAAEGLVEVRPRRGPVVAAPEPAAAEELGETPEWMAGVLEGAAGLQVRLPALADLVRRWTAAQPVRCLCVDSTEDGRVALVHEMSAQWGMECEAASPEERGSQRGLAAAVRAADVVVCTHFNAGAVRPLARSTHRPVVVAATRPDLVEAIEAALRRGPLTAVVADPAYAERLRVLPNGDRLRTVLAADPAAIEMLSPDEAVLLTLAAQQKVQRPLRLLAAPGHFVAPLDARALARVLIRANLAPGRNRSLS
jgi:PAS domain S-box-containing protein